MASCPAEVQEFVLVPLHSEPSHAVQEIDALYDVYTDVINKWGTNVSSAGELGEPPQGSQVGRWDGYVPQEASCIIRAGATPAVSRQGAAGWPSCHSWGLVPAHWLPQGDL